MPDQLTLQAINAIQVGTVLALSPLIAGVINRLKAILESKRGPPVLQPYYDLAKLFKKETVIPERASAFFMLAPFLSFTAYVVISLVIPVVTPYPLPYGILLDLLGGALMFGLAGVVGIVAAIDAHTNYTALGASRSASFSALAEPTLIMVFFGVALITGTNNPYVTNNLLASSFSAYLSPTHLLVVAAFFLLLLAETGKLPVESSGLMEFGMLEDGRTFGHSGRLLGLFRWNGWMKQFLLYSVFVNVFALPWGMSDAVSLPGALENIALLLGKLLLVVGVVAGVEATLAKVRLFKIRDFLALSFSLAILSIFVFVVVGVP